MGEKLAGYSIFKIDKNIDAGNIVYQDTFNIHQDTYASDVYEKVLILFNKSYDHICEPVSYTHLTLPTIYSV